MLKPCAWVIVSVVAATMATPVEAAGLAESARLAAVYDLILQARFDQARAELTRTCPPAPPESCLALSAVIQWWEIQLDPNNRSLDKRLQEAAATATDAAERWTAREPQRAEHSDIADVALVPGARPSRRARPRERAPLRRRACPRPPARGRGLPP